MTRSSSPRRSDLLVFVLAVAISACSDTGTGLPPVGEPARMLVVSGDEQEGTVGAELPEPLVARVTDAEGRPVGNQIVNFRVISGGGSVFAGTGLTNADGIARERWTLGPSTADSQRVEARAVDNQTGAPLVFANFTARALADAPARIVIDRDTVFHASIGDTSRARASVLDRFDNPAEAVVTWQVGDTAVAGDGGNGLTEARQEGTTWLAATALGLADTAVVVVRQAATTISVTPAEATVDALGDTVRLVAVVRDARGHVVPHAVVSWTSSDPGVVEMVGADGNGVARGGGNVNITASSGSARGTAAIVVRQVAATIQVTPSPVSVGVRDTTRLVAQARDANGFAIPSPGVRWASSTTAVATVDATGLVRGAARGNANVSATADGAVGSARVDVKRELVFTGITLGQGSYRHLYRVFEDGTGLRKITEGEVVDWFGRWSPDGRRIVFSRADPRRDQDLFIVDADGARLTRLTQLNSRQDLRFPHDPDWSPDGSRIVFRIQESSNQIYVIGVDGSGLTNLTNNAAFNELTPAWSPDGTRIAFSSNRGGGRDIYVMNADGSNVQRLTSLGNANYPRWSPDGRRIVFAHHVRDTGSIYVMNADGTAPGLILSALRANTPDWAPDGDRIVFMAAGANDHDTIHLMRPDGSGVEALHLGDSFPALAPSWRP